jgi:hypothetical protein
MSICDATSSEIAFPTRWKTMKKITTEPARSFTVQIHLIPITERKAGLDNYLEEYFHFFRCFLGVATTESPTFCEA